MKHMNYIGNPTSALNLIDYLKSYAERYEVALDEVAVQAVDHYGFPELIVWTESDETDEE